MSQPCFFVLSCFVTVIFNVTNFFLSQSCFYEITFSSHNPVSSSYTSVWVVSVTAREMLLAVSVTAIEMLLAVSVTAREMLLAVSVTAREMLLAVSVTAREMLLAVSVTAREMLLAVSVTAREMLLARQDEYKSAAMQAKTAGDLKTATKYLAVSKVTHPYPW